MRRAAAKAQRPSARRSPAAWLRRRLLARSLALLIPVALAVGVCIGAFLGEWVATVYLNAAAILLMAGGYAWFRFNSRWSVANLEKGLDAEYRIGQVIEYALVPPGCAVAHGVTGIGVGGDIDHLVATPAGLWVIETKVRAVPRKRFPALLDRIADNVRAVADWAPGVPVRGCLVLLEPFDGRRDYEAGNGTPVIVHDEKSLRDALRAAALEEGPGDGRLARRVWALGRVED